MTAITAVKGGILHNKTRIFILQSTAKRVTKWPQQHFHKPIPPLFQDKKRNRQTSWEPPFTLAICHHDDEAKTENTSTSFERAHCVLANFNPQYIYC